MEKHALMRTIRIGIFPSKLDDTCGLPKERCLLLKNYSFLWRPNFFPAGGTSAKWLKRQKKEKQKKQENKSNGTKYKNSKRCSGFCFQNSKFWVVPMRKIKLWKKETVAMLQSRFSRFGRNLLKRRVENAVCSFKILYSFFRKPPRVNGLIAGNKRVSVSYDFQIERGEGILHPLSPPPPPPLPTSGY